MYEDDSHLCIDPDEIAEEEELCRGDHCINCWEENGKTVHCEQPYLPELKNDRILVCSVCGYELDLIERISEKDYSGYDLL